MSISQKVREIEVFKHKSEEFATLSLYFPRKNDIEQLAYISLTYKIYLVKDLRANLLIGNDIISLENFFINI